LIPDAIREKPNIVSREDVGVPGMKPRVNPTYHNAALTLSRPEM
jgi:hypothetical protein